MFSASSQHLGFFLQVLPAFFAALHDGVFLYSFLSTPPNTDFYFSFTSQNIITHMLVPQISNCFSWTYKLVKTIAGNDDYYIFRSLNYNRSDKKEVAIVARGRVGNLNMLTRRKSQWKGEWGVNTKQSYFLEQIKEEAGIQKHRVRRIYHQA